MFGALDSKSCFWSVECLIQAVWASGWHVLIPLIHQERRDAQGVSFWDFLRLPSVIPHWSYLVNLVSLYVTLCHFNGTRQSSHVTIDCGARKALIFTARDDESLTDISFEIRWIRCGIAVIYVSNKWRLGIQPEEFPETYLELKHSEPMQHRVCFKKCVHDKYGNCK